MLMQKICQIFHRKNFLSSGLDEHSSVSCIGANDFSWFFSGKIFRLKFTFSRFDL